MDEKKIELVRKAKKGDMEAFSNLIISFEEDLFRIASIRLNSTDDVEDAIQETIEKALKNIKRLKKVEFFKTWLIKILINKCNEIYRKKKDKLNYDDCVLLKYDNDIASNIASNIDFFILLKNLDAKERMIFVLYFSENLTLKEISKILKEPESTIRNRKARALKKIQKECIDENNNFKFL